MQPLTHSSIVALLEHLWSTTSSESTRSSTCLDWSVVCRERKRRSSARAILKAGHEKYLAAQDQAGVLCRFVVSAKPHTMSVFVPAGLRRSAPRRLTTTGAVARRREQLDEQSAQANYRSMSAPSSSSSIIFLAACFVRFLDDSGDFDWRSRLLRFPFHLQHSNSINQTPSCK